MNDFLTFFALLMIAWAMIGPVVALALAVQTRRELAELRNELRALRLVIRDNQKPTGGGPVAAPAAPPVPVAGESAGAAPPPRAPPSARPEAEVATAERKAGRRLPHARTGSEIEQFLGGKLAAWLGGIALFLGVVFFVKYAFDRNLLSPAMRVATGFATGAGLSVAGIVLRHRRRYEVLTQTLIATGILISYGAAFTAHALYSLPGFTQTGTIACMGAITCAAIALAVRLRAPVIAVLGMAGGFLTPWLVSTGQDQTLMLFGHVLVLSLGLIAVAWKRRWTTLIPCAAAGTLLTQVGWFIAHFWESGYAKGEDTAILVGVFLLFPALFTAASVLQVKRSQGGTPADLLRGSPMALVALAGIALHIFLGLPALREPPHLVMGMGAALAVLLLVIQEAHRVPLAGAFAAVGLALLAIHATMAGPPSEHPVAMLAWCVGSVAVLGVYPFLRRSNWQPATVWAAPVLAYVLFFPAVYRLVERAWPNEWMGAVPAAFALPPLLSFAVLARRSRGDAELRRSNLVLFGGAAVFFIAVIVPAQFSRQWITIGWALQGAALCWLSTKCGGHWGLRLSGFALLCAASARLVFHPVVLGSYGRIESALWNWTLYTFGLAALCAAAGARWLPPPRDVVASANLRTLLCALCGVLLFLLLQIQIANTFADPGERFEAMSFGGDFALSMTRSIAWALYALVLLVGGFRWRIRGARYGGLGLLGVTLAKLFLHDLANIESLYRIAAFVGVAVLALVAAFLYQRFSPLRGDEPA